MLLIATRIALANRRFADAESYASEGLGLSNALARGPASSADVGESLLMLAKSRAGTQTLSQQRELPERAVQCLTNSLTLSHPLTVEARDLLNRARLS